MSAGSRLPELALFLLHQLPGRLRDSISPHWLSLGTFVPSLGDTGFESDFFISLSSVIPAGSETHGLDKGSPWYVIPAVAAPCAFPAPMPPWPFPPACANVALDVQNEAADTPVSTTVSIGLFISVLPKCDTTLRRVTSIRRQRGAGCAPGIVDVTTLKMQTTFAFSRSGSSSVAYFGERNRRFRERVRFRLYRHCAVSILWFRRSGGVRAPGDLGPALRPPSRPNGLDWRASTA